MDVAVAFSPDGEEVVATLSGPASIDLFHVLVAGLRADERYRAGLNLLVDCTDLVAPDLDDEQLRIAVEPAIARDWEFPPRAIAVLAQDERVLRFARLANAYMGGSIFNRRVFSDDGEARAWLAAQPAPR
jgi:hypothetical protein